MDIYEKVKEMIVEQLGVDEEEVSPSKTFRELNADSLDVVELVMAIEEEFDLEISDEEVENIRSVEDAVNYIQENKK